MTTRLTDDDLREMLRAYREHPDEAYEPVPVADEDVTRALVELQELRTENARLRSLLHSEGVPAHLPGWAVWTGADRFTPLIGANEWGDVVDDARDRSSEWVDDEIEATALYRLVPVRWIEVLQTATAEDDTEEGQLCRDKGWDCLCELDDVRHPAADLLGVFDE